MPTITIELTEEQAAAIFSNYHNRPVKDSVQNLVCDIAREFIYKFPDDMPGVIERFRMYHPATPSPPPTMFTLTSLSLSGGHVPPPILHLQPSDVILLQTPQKLKDELAHTILTKTKDLFPDNRVMIFSGGLHLTAIKKAPSAQPDIKASSTDTPDETYEKLWKPIIEPNGTIDLDALKQELHDYSLVMDAVSLVYDHITCGRFSKCTTDPQHIIDEFESRIATALANSAKPALSADDIKCLWFIHDRLVEVYGEDINFDYMHRFRQVFA